MPPRKSVPRKTEKALYQEAGNQCLMCGLNDVAVLVIHHIVPAHLNPEHNPKDMILLCRNCHDRADRGEIDPEALWKAKHEAWLARRQEPNRSAVPSIVVGDGNVVAGSVNVAGDLNIRLPPGKRAAPPYVVPGTISEDPVMRGYLKHLFDRYNEFKGWECSTTGTKPGFSRIYSAYKREMKYDWKHSPQALFPRAVAFLQRRIDDTKLGRIKKSRREKLYSTYEEFRAESGDAMHAIARPRERVSAQLSWACEMGVPKPALVCNVVNVGEVPVYGLAVELVLQYLDRNAKLMQERPLFCQWPLGKDGSRLEPGDSRQHVLFPPIAVVERALALPAEGLWVSVKSATGEICRVGAIEVRSYLEVLGQGKQDAPASGPRPD